MNWEQIEGNWKQYKGKIQTQWGQLTNNDVDVIAGKRTELIGLLQTRYGHDKAKAEHEIDSWVKHLN